MAPSLSLLAAVLAFAGSTGAANAPHDHSERAVDRHLAKKEFSH